MPRSRVPLLIFAAASAAGVGFAVAAGYIHFRLDGSSAYTSFCNISSSVNCDSVLQSRYARFAGLPIAWLGALTHLALAAAASAALRSAGAPRAWAMRIVVLGGIGSAAFSTLMAYLSFAELQTACLMCMGLYTVAAAQFASAIVIARESEDPLFPPGGLGVALAVAFAATAAIGRFAWPAAETPQALRAASLAELRDVDPEFFDWYFEQPVVEMAAQPGISATVVIVEFSDFECAYCRRNREFLRDLESRHPGVLAVVHRHFPLDPACNELVDRPLHTRACRAAEAAECARLQDRYGEYADILFANQERLFESNLEALAERAGLDIEPFRACMRSRETLSRVVADARAGGKLDLESTPTVFFNGRRIRGTLPDAGKYDLAVMIEARLAAGETLTAPSSPSPAR